MSATHSLPQIIFVEGVPGSGKSTCAEKLTAELLQRGHRARWHHEHDPEHPIISQGTPPAIEDQSGRLARWREFAEAIGKNGETVVLDGALFQRQINAFVKALREPEGVLFVESVFQKLRNLDCLLIYFFQADISMHFKWLEANRPGAREHFWNLMARSELALELNTDPETSICRYYESVQRFTQTLIPAFPGRSQIIDSSDKKWPRIYSEAVSMVA